VRKTLAVILVTLSCAFNCAFGSAEELLRNGSFERWTGDSPVFWSGSNIRRETEFNTDGAGVALYGGKSENQQTFLAYGGLKLKPGAKYRVELFYRMYNLSGSTVKVSIRDGEKTIARLGTLKVHYWHSKGAFIPLTFKAPNTPIDPKNCSLHFSYSGGPDGFAVIDEVSLSPVDEIPVGIRFVSGENGKVTVFASIHNNRSNTRKVTWSFRLVNYFNETVKGGLWSGAKTLMPDQGETFSHSFYAIKSRVYRGILSLEYADGFKREIVSYFEPTSFTDGRKVHRLDLLGGWEKQFTSQSAPKPLADKWQKVSIPDKAARGDRKWGGKSKLDLDNKRYVWYRVPFDGPESASGQRMILRLLQAPLSPVVYMNGVKVGSAVGRVPLALDITDAFKGGEPNLLEIRLSTWRDFIRMENGNACRTIPYGLDTGILDAVELVIRPDVYVARVSCFPSWREKKLKVRYILANDSNENVFVSLSGIVYGEGSRKLRIPTSRRYLRVGERVQVWLKTPWQKPDLWFHHAPYLHRLVTTLKKDNGKIADEISTRFGFREVWTEGPDFMINGRKLYMPARLSFPHMTHVGGKRNRASAWTMLRLYKDNGLTHARNYTGHPSFHRDVADEIGFTLRESFELNLAYGGFSYMPKQSNDYWRLCADYVRKFALERSNHPSIVIWDIQNETFLCGAQIKRPEIVDEFVKLHGVLRAALPGALTAHDDGYNPRNDADVTLLHYPISFIRHFPTSPNFPGRVFVKGRRQPMQLGVGSFTWHGDRPLGLGECHPMEGTYPASLTYLFGDEDVYQCVYAGRHRWRGKFGPMMRAHNEQLKVLFRLYREAGVCLINPWPWCNEAIRDTMVENVVYLKQYDRNFTGGNSIKRTAVIVHGASLEREAELKWSLLSSSGGPVQSKTIKLPTLRDGSVSYQDFNFLAPTTRHRLEMSLQLEVISGNETIARSTSPIKIWPFLRLEVPNDLKIALYDADGRTARALTDTRIPFRRIVSLAEWELRGARLVIIGENSLFGNLVKGYRADVQQYVNGGGRMLILAQENAVPGWLPLTLTRRRGVYWRRAHIRIPDHPLTRGLRGKDLMFWRGDAQTSRFDYFKPFSGNFLPILDSGSMQGLVNSPLLELPRGKGSFLLCQMAIVDKITTEPAATRLWQNLFDYVDLPTYMPEMGRAILIAGVHTNLTAFIKRFGFDVEIVNPLFASGVSLRSAAAVIVDGSVQLTGKALNSLVAYANAGGKVWVHGVTSETAEMWSLVFYNLKVEPLSYHGKIGDSRTTKIAYDPAIAGLSNSDLYWKGVPQFGWAGEDYGTPFVGTIVNTRISASAPARALTEYGNLLRQNVGKGYVLIDNILWDSAWREISYRAPRVASIIATNMGIRVAGALRDRPVTKDLKYQSLNLNGFYNIGLSDVLPKGIKKYAGIPFEVNSGGKGAIMLGSKRLEIAGAEKKLPEKITGLPVQNEVDYLYFLQTAWDVYESGPGWGTGEVFGGYRINYSDGTTEYAPLQGFIHAAIPCDNHGDLPGAKIGWPSREPSSDRAPQTIFSEWLDKYVRLEGRWIQREHTNRLYVMRWANPFPEKTIRTIDFIGANGFVQPILLAITAAGAF